MALNGNNAIWYSQGVDNSGLRKGREEAKKIWQDSTNDLEVETAKRGKIWQNTGKVIAAAIPIELMRRFGSEAIKVRGEFQQLEIAFGTMLKSKERADKLLYGAGGLSDFAASTPFGLQSAASGAKQLIAYGSTAETVIDELRMLGDVAAGTGQQIGDLVYLYGTLRTQGRAYMMDIRQFAGRGIPIYDELAKVLNTTKDQVNDFVSAGKVGFAEVEQAFKNMTANGGMYGGLMEEQSKSILGRIEQLKDAIGIMFNEMGKSSEGVIYNAIDGAAALVQNYEQVGKVLIGLIATYGAYRAAIIANNVVLGVQQQMLLQTALSGQALTKWQALQAVATTRLTAVTNILNKTMLANPYVLIATVLVGAATAMWALHDSTTAAERAQERYNQRLNDAKTKFDELIAIVRDETKAITDRQAALENLRRIYPGLFADMDIEAVKLANLTDLTRQATQADRDRARESAERMIAALNVDAGRQRVTIQHGSIFERRAARKRLAEIEKEIEAQEEILAREEELSKRAEEEAARSPIYGESYKAAQKEWEEAKRALTAIEKDKNAFTQKQYEDTRARVEAAKKAYADLGGDVSTGGARGGRTSDPERQAQERAALGREYENEVAQARIDAMADGLDKTLAQNALNFEREKAQIEEQYTDEMDFTAEMRQALIDAAKADQNAADAAARTKDQEAALDGFRSFQQEYLRLYNEFQEKRRKAAEAGAGASGLALADSEFDESIRNLATKFAESNQQFQSWATGIKMLVDGAMEDGSATVINAAIGQISEMITRAKMELRALEQGGIDSSEAERYGKALARIEELESQIKTLWDKKGTEKADNDWKKLYSTLQKVANEFEDIGDQIGGTAGDAIKLAGNIAVSTISMIDGIKTVAQTGAEAIKGIERASVILTIIQAAIQVITAISGAFKDNEEQLRAASDAAFEYEMALKRIATAKRYDLFDTVFGENSLGKFKEATSIVRETTDEIIKQIDEINNRSTDWNDYMPKVVWGDWTAAVEEAKSKARGIEAFYDGRSWWNKFMHNRNDKIKTTKLNIDDYFNSDGSITNEQLEALKVWYEEYADGLDAAEKQTIESLIASGERYVEATEQQTAYIENLFGDLASSIADSMVEAFVATGDAAADMGDIVQDVAKQIAKSMVMDELLKGDDAIFGKNLQDKISGMVKTGDMTGANAEMAKAVEQANSLGPYFTDLFKTLGIAIDTAEDASRTSVNKGYSQTSQDSFDKGLGIWTNMDNTLWDIRDIMRAGMPLQGFDTAAIEPVLNIAEMMRTNHSIMQANTETALGHLSAISTNTHELHAMREDLAAVREDMRLVRGLSEDIADNTEKFVR